jgi:hypothetical protein
VPKTAWRCSQCGTVNEAEARACAGCGKWPSLFDLQESVEEAPAATGPAPFDVEEFEPEVFEPDTFEAEPFDPRGMRADELEPEPFEPVGEAEEGAEKSRFPRWIVTAIWVIGLLIWILVNAFSDSG